MLCLSDNWVIHLRLIIIFPQSFIELCVVLSGIFMGPDLESIFLHQHYASASTLDCMEIIPESASLGQERRIVCRLIRGYC